MVPCVNLRPLIGHGPMDVNGGSYPLMVDNRMNMAIWISLG